MTKYSSAPDAGVMLLFRGSRPIIPRLGLEHGPCECFVLRCNTNSSTALSIVAWANLLDLKSDAIHSNEADSIGLLEPSIPVENSMQAKILKVYD